MEQIIAANPKQWFHYRAETLTDLAQFLEQMARNQDALMKSAETKKKAREYQVQAYTYRDAAKIVRETLIEPYGLTKMLEEHDNREVATALWANWLNPERDAMLEECKP